MKRAAIVVCLVVMFALAVGAGVVVDKLMARLPTAAPVTEGTLTQELQLSPTQRTQMQTIWEGVQQTSQDCIAKAKAAQHEQDAAVRAMLTPEQQTRYAELSQQTATRIGVLDATRQNAFKDAVTRTTAILDEKQRKIYQQIIRDRVGDRPGIVPDQTSENREFTRQTAGIGLE